MTAPRPRTNLAPPQTSFIGRGVELEAAQRLLDEERLVTVLGPPGVGKTRFAVELALGRAERGLHPGGVWFCDLTNARGPESIAGAVAHALEVTLTATARRASAEQLAIALGGRGDVLLILDNFEHVAEHASVTVGAWVAGVPGVRILVTSRQRLEIAREVPFELPPLGLPAGSREVEASEAVQLFLARTRAVRHGYVLAPRDAPVVAALVRELDGLPLAIELAAARMTVLGPAQLLHRPTSELSARHAGPGPGRAAPARHATLRSAIEASWELLGPAEHAVLAQTSVFAGGFDLEAASAVLEPPPGSGGAPILDVLQALRERSLLSTFEPAGFSGELRFHLLATVLEHASSKLGPDEQDAVARRHEAYYRSAGVRLAARVEIQADPASFRRLDLEAENLMAVHRRAIAIHPPTGASASCALEAALAIDPVLAARGPYAARLALLDEALAAADALAPGELGSTDLVVRALLARAHAQAVVGRGERADADIERALAAARDDAAVLGRVLAARGAVALRAGRTAAAKESLEQAADRLERAGDRRATIRARAQLALALLELGAVEDARAVGESTLARARDAGDRLAEPALAYVLGLAALDERRVDDAAAMLRGGLAVARDLASRADEAALRTALGWCLHEAGRLDDARAAYEAALVVARDLGDVVDEPTLVASLGTAEALSGMLAEAGARFDAAAHETIDGRRPVQARALDLMRGVLDVARARHAFASGDRASAEAHLAGAERRAASGANHAGFACRLARRWLVHEMSAIRATGAAPREAGPSPAALVVESTGGWFRVPGGERVGLHTRKPVRRVLQVLAERRRDAPGRALTLEVLLRSGWPDERIAARAGAGRVHNAVTTLRKLGLRELLLAREGGWLIDPDVPLVVVDEP